jgi:large subunit ribosomal protein L11
MAKKSKKKIMKIVKLQIPGGQATPAPPVGPALGQLQVSSVEFCKQEKVGKITKDQVREIARAKMKDLNCPTVEAAMNMVEGSARSMGIIVEE